MFSGVLFSWRFEDELNSNALSLPSPLPPTLPPPARQEHHHHWPDSSSVCSPEDQHHCLCEATLPGPHIRDKRSIIHVTSLISFQNFIYSFTFTLDSTSPVVSRARTRTYACDTTPPAVLLSLWVSW